MDHQTYDNGKQVINTDLYDVASISKMISTLPNVMQLYDKNKVTLDTKLKDMVPFFANTNKANIIFKDLLSHYAGLQAWIPFYKATLDSNNKPSEKYYRKIADSKRFYNKSGRQSLFRNDYHDTIMKIIAESPIISKNRIQIQRFYFHHLKGIFRKKNA